MSLPTKDELLKEVASIIEGSFESSKSELKKEAETLKSSYFKKIEEICSSVSL